MEILNPFLGKDSEDDTLSVLEILAADEHARLLKIEMPNNWHRAKSVSYFRYNARLKFQRYEESMLLEAARQEGRQEGRREDVIVGSVPAIRCR